MKEDVDCIKSGWLTDNAIAFWEEWLERERLKEYPKADIVLLRPSMSFMLRQTRDPLTLKDALPNFTRTTHIFLPINDARDVTIAEGGSHWSLLVVSVVDRVAFHYDSLRPTNSQEALISSEKLGILVGKELKFVDLSESPQQENGSDCGVFVCLQMQFLLLSRLLTAQATDKVNMSLGGKLIDAASGRKQMLKIIEGYRKEGERRRSTFIPLQHSGDVPHQNDLTPLGTPMSRMEGQIEFQKYTWNRGLQIVSWKLIRPLKALSLDVVAHA
ncbi:MAG: hypothetical protein Q9165_004712 [Trypethelium subeluteriae]